MISLRSAADRVISSRIAPDRSITLDARVHRPISNYNINCNINCNCNINPNPNPNLNLNINLNPNLNLNLNPNPSLSAPCSRFSL